MHMYLAEGCLALLPPLDQYVTSSHMKTLSLKPHRDHLDMTMALRRGETWRQQNQQRYPRMRQRSSCERLDYGFLLRRRGRRRRRTRRSCGRCIGSRLVAGGGISGCLCESSVSILDDTGLCTYAVALAASHVEGLAFGGAGVAHQN